MQRYQLGFGLTVSELFPIPVLDQSDSKENQTQKRAPPKVERVGVGGYVCVCVALRVPRASRL